jgi:hypothetical protein
MTNNQPSARIRKPFVKMQIEKVNLRTNETMGIQCYSLSSPITASDGIACANNGICHDFSG